MQKFLFILENASPFKNYIQHTPEQISTIQFENEISPVATNGNINRPCAWQNSKYKVIIIYHRVSRAPFFGGGGVECNLEVIFLPVLGLKKIVGPS